VVYPSKNLDAFTAEVSALMNDPNRLHEMGRYARHKVIRDNSLETVGKKFVDRLITQGFGQRKAI
jgi:glycosyltransferase involved in cell wall biosynthesis